MRERYTEKLGIRISKQMMNEIDEFVLNHHASKNSIVRQAISSFLNIVPTVPIITIKQPELKPVKNDDPFEASQYDGW